MGRFTQPSDGKGSLKDIQLLVNKSPDLINSKIKDAFPELANEKIIWVSPLESDDYAEYRDNEFIEKIGLDIAEIKLEEFWPIRGPQWDALATTNNGKIILIEAKANIPELVSPGTSASLKSKSQIDISLNELKTFLSKKGEINWSGKFYQYTNRIAHLFLFKRKKRERSIFSKCLFHCG